MKRIRTANNTVVYKIENSDECKTLEDAYSLLKCKLVQIVNLNNGDCFIIDEEGKLKNPPLLINPLATLVWSKSFSSDNENFEFYDEIVGDAIWVERKFRKDYL